ncbi:ankyrin repeat domain-containing protein [Streptomyces halstedii]|uniref:ankyrin repeat domain-containing protein n=1 Tax=Streptomyces halstedii TaxID=1944 RepID=UPI00364C4168
MVDRLARASGDGDVAVVRRLLDAGAEVDAPVRAGRTALDLAVRAGHAETVGVLLAAGADLRQRAGEYAGLTPLCLAATRGHTAVVDVFLEAGDPTGAQGRMGYVPLVLAAPPARSLWWFRSSPFLFSLFWLFCFRLVVVAVRLCRRC